MALDFTFAAFEALCRSVQQMQVFTIQEFVQHSRAPDPPFVMLRFDVDYREDHALRLAQIAAHHGLHGSFYFRHRHGRFNHHVIAAVAALEHEIGYHYETLDVCGGNYDRAGLRFLDHVAALRSAGHDIRTAVAHGNRPVAPTYTGNRDLLIKKPGLLQQAGLVAEATLNIDYSQLVYASDAGWRWRWCEHFTPGQRGTPTSLTEIIDRLPDRDRGICLTLHPQQWFERPAALRYFRARNRLGRRFVPVLRRWRLFPPDE